MRDAVIIGAGHNGLVTAAFLAKAGLKPLVLERADRVGGCAITSEIAPGFRCPTLSHRAAIDRSVVRALDLERHGLRVIRPEALVSAPAADGRLLTLWADKTAAQHEIAAFSPQDAERYPAFLEAVAATTAVLDGLLAAPAPPLDGPDAKDLISLLKAGRRFRGLGRVNAYRLLRWLPMAVADLAHEWFASEPLCAVIAADGVVGSFVGPRSAGSAAVLLLRSAGERHPIAGGWTAHGGVGAVSDAIASAARQAGAEIRTGADVGQILVDDGVATGVVLGSGEQISARVVVSNADPRRTLLGLVDPAQLTPELVSRVQRIRMRGTLAKVNYALSSLPAVRGLAPGDAAHAALSGCVRIGADTDSLERAFDAAKYGGYPESPWIEFTIPTIADPSLAPAGQHVLSAYVYCVPFDLRGAAWDAERERLGDVVTRTIATVAPGFDRLVLARQVITPLDLERTYGLTGGHPFHGELAIDQLFSARPLLGWARYSTPIRNLFLCGSGTHPGTGVDGRSGALAARAILAHWERSRG
jgi:phytoene dehydrogenase-like protein